MTSFLLLGKWTDRSIYHGKAAMRISNKSNMTHFTKIAYVLIGSQDDVQTPVIGSGLLVAAQAVVVAMVKAQTMRMVM